jgi:hypothetical protein
LRCHAFCAGTAFALPCCFAPPFEAACGEGVVVKVAGRERCERLPDVGVVGLCTHKLHEHASFAIGQNALGSARRAQRGGDDVGIAGTGRHLRGNAACVEAPLADAIQLCQRV